MSNCVWSAIDAWAWSISLGVYWSGNPTEYLRPSTSVTSAVLSFSLSVRLLTCLDCSWVSRFPNDCFCVWLELPISFWAKKASTTTIRIGNAALLKNLLIKEFRASSGRERGSSVAPALLPLEGLHGPLHCFNAATNGKLR